MINHSWSIFQFITGISFKWNYVIGRSVVLLVWIGLWTKLIIYRVPPDPVRWSCRGFGFLWRVFMLNWMLWTKNDLKIFHRNQFNAPPNMNLVTSFVNFECQSCGIFEGLSYHQDDEVIDPNIFAATVGLGNIIKKLFSSKFMGMVSSVSVIIDTGDTYSYSSNKGDFVKLDKKKPPRNIKGIAKGLEISGFVIVDYSVRSESGRMIALRDQAYYVPVLPKDLRIIYPQGICTPEGYKVTFISHCHDAQDGYAEIDLKEDKPGWQKAEPVERVYVKYDPKNNLPTNKTNLPNQREKEFKALTNAVCVNNMANQNLTPSQKYLL